ncbi:hypothetical protein NY2A_B614R [Paramecium bursaria Chlorella virus NY2A]|uniref:Uncharacterized protein B614R n=1 Tax=Paramecium bursaria Chlorella virus NY2A TaxID=46021 RepID=A7IXD9_PBCVN|nr:hypothetical protein NY2A_B614R [Paramecium bursaria Chlorella virus NY2A]ABT15013.1 hypothetical protein NY2A_B614R [Paramecium bursaria Chlorella virus NY2A]
MTDYNKLFEQRIRKYIDIVKYIRDPDYHGEIIISRDNGDTIAKRENCSNENLQRVENAVNMLQKFDKTYSRNKILIYTEHQMVFVGQCLLDRLWAKHEAMELFTEKGYSWNTLGSSKQKNFVINLIRHERVLKNTIRIFAKIIRLRASINKIDEDINHVVKQLRRMILDRGFSSSSSNSQRLELQSIPFWNYIKAHYLRLGNSYRWKQFITALSHAEVNIERNSSTIFGVHRTRMMGLLDRATKGI